MDMFQTEFPFELPKGYLDASGILHTAVNKCSIVLVSIAGRLPSLVITRANKIMVK